MKSKSKTWEKDQKNPSVCFMLSAAAAWQAASEALQKGLGRQKAFEVVRKNPGVLAIRVPWTKGGRELWAVWG